MTRTWSLEVSRAEAEQRWLPLAAAEAEGTPAARAEATPAAGAEGTPEADVRQPDAGPPGAARDRFTYRIIVGYAEVSLPESRLAEPWRELIDRARAAARSRPEPGPDEGPLPRAGPSADAGHGTPEELL
ncbi:hypothetical protein [Arthrobacter sp. TMS2-4]